MVQMMKKNTILRFMGKLSGRYLKLVFPKIEPHKRVKKTKIEEAEENTENTDEIIYIILIEGVEERTEKTDEKYK